jgi:hypothetical protein
VTAVPAKPRPLDYSRDLAPRPNHQPEADLSAASGLQSHLVEKRFAWTGELRVSTEGFDPIEVRPKDGIIMAQDSHWDSSRRAGARRPSGQRVPRPYGPCAAAARR